MSTSRTAGHRAGLTLLETVVAIGLLLLFMTALTELYLSFSTSAAVQQSLTGANVRALHALASFQSDTANADAVLASHTFASGTTYGSATTTLALELPAVSSSGVPITGSYDYVAYYLSGTDFYRELDAAGGSSRAGGTILVATDIASLVMSYDTADPSLAQSVSLDLAVMAGTRATTTEEVRTTAYLRNHP